jgi:hypothetical protein
MRVVADQFKIFELEILDVLDGRVQPHFWQRARGARKLQLGLLDVIGKKARGRWSIPTGKNFNGFHSRNLHN